VFSGLPKTPEVHHSRRIGSIVSDLIAPALRTGLA
jgi:hypothetical protein